MGADNCEPGSGSAEALAAAPIKIRWFKLFTYISLSSVTHKSTAK
jgi:hypothetical protein